MCPRGEIGRHNGLKIRAFLECQFESGRGHHLMKNKIYLVFDNTKKSLKIKNLLIRKIKTTTLKKSEIIIVLGGDGFMLQTLKKLYKFKKPFYGINSGNYGFLMNKFSNKNILKHQPKELGQKLLVKKS